MWGHSVVGVGQELPTEMLGVRVGDIDDAWVVPGGPSQWLDDGEKRRSWCGKYVIKF
jgi:hypothetical protein